MKTVEQLEQTHENYAEIARQATYHYKSWLGGETYKSGSYLTQYLGESSAPGNQYAKRINSTPLDNHVATTIDIYRSFLFRTLPKRELGVLIKNPLVKQWLTDTDQEGQGMDSFLKTANDLAMVMGSAWILVDKPSYKVETQAEEIALGIRAYANVYIPQNVLNWYYERNVGGKLVLKHIKVRETDNTDSTVFTCWYEDYVEKYTVSKNGDGTLAGITDHEVYDNPLGYVPFVFHAPLKSPVKGVGTSLVADVANQQKFIYNCLSEVDQAIRVGTHPTLVKTPSTEANAGAGGIVTIQDDMDPGLKPYLLAPTTAAVDAILRTVEKAVEAIQRMTHTSSIQATTGSPMSGVALQTERALLNAKLNDIADTLKETEIMMWNIWLDWQAITKPDDFSLDYPETFDMRDEHLEMAFLLQARSSGVNNPAFQKEIDRQIIALVVDDVIIQSEILEDIDDADVETHQMVGPDGDVVTVANTDDHQQLVDIGYVNI